MEKVLFLFCFAVSVSVASVNPNRIRPLADDFTVVCESPDPANVYCWTPAICRLPSGRLIVTTDWGGKGVKKGEPPGHIFLSDDRGRTWRESGRFSFTHARPFLSGGVLYLIGGQESDLQIMKSVDEGGTWSAERALTHGMWWHASACNVWYANGCVYLVADRRVGRLFKGWYPCELAPILMRAKIGNDLMKPDSWTYASELSFQQALPGALKDPPIDYFGIPFYTPQIPGNKPLPGTPRVAPIGWLETNVVQFNDPDNIWFDPKGKTFYLWARAHTAGTGYAAIAKVVEHDDGSMTTSLAEAPSGKKMLYVPCPGGQMRFHVLYDDVTKLFWLLSSQSVDSMTRWDRLPKSRYNLPNNKRHRLQLNFSKNMVDWCFAGIVCMGKTPKEARHYASMAIDGDNLCIVSRSGDARAKSAHDGNLITFHTVKDFRSLVY